MSELMIMQDGSEIVQYDQKEIPYFISPEILSGYPDMRALCHWHEELEWIRIRWGRMNYYINGHRLLLEEGDCLMVNSRQMHYGYSAHREDCGFTCILFHPCLLAENRLLYQKYLLPVLERQELEFLHFRAGSDGTDAIAALLDQILDLKERGETARELEIIGSMHILWSRIFSNSLTASDQAKAPADPDLSVQRDMVSYIHRHYMDKITLADIASSGHICRNKCCVIFRRYLQQSPIDFLNSYRLKVSCRQLTDTEDPITQIALSCGFPHPSHYSKLFRQHYGCSPKEWRRMRKIFI